MHIQSVDQNKAIKTVKRTITELDRSKIEEQKKAIRAGYDIDIIPSDLATYGRDAKALLKELQSQNERMFLVTFLVLNTGRTEQELENNVFQASSIAQKHNCNLCRLDFQQEQGLMSSLPLADDRKNGRLFEQDSSYYLLCSLENLDEQGQLKSKAAMFTKRTIRPERTVTSVDTPSEALAVSIGEHGRVDLPYMAELLGTPGEYDRITTELSGVIFKDPAADPTDPEAGWQMADEYLSGDVRAKLRMLAPISLFVAFLALMAKWLLTLSSYVVAPLMLYIFGCGIYTVYRQTWDQFLILLVAEFLCFVLFVGATAIVEGVEKFSGWLRDLI